MAANTNLSEALRKAHRCIDVGDEAELAKLIHQNSGLLSARDRSGRTLLSDAVVRGQANIVRLLVARGADVNAVDEVGMSALHYAATEESCELCEILLANGCYVDAQDMWGNTPLSNAVFNSRGRGDVIQLLIRNGADKTIANKRGISPETLAKSIKNHDIAKWLDA